MPELRVNGSHGGVRLEGRRRIVPLAELRPAPYNPKSRTEKSRLSHLVASMREIGLLYPIMVSRSMDVIDGHRRLAAAKIIGWEEIEVNVIDADPALIYRSVNNGSARRMNANDTMRIWLKSKDAVSKRMADKLQDMEDMLGNEMVCEVAERGHSHFIYELAKGLARYCGIIPSPSGLTKIIRWVMNKSGPFIAHTAMKQGQPPDVIAEAIRRNKPVVWALEVNDED